MYAAVPTSFSGGHSSMILEDGTAKEFKHAVLFFVEMRRCSRGHVYVADPAFDQSWKRGVIPHINECPDCQFEFEVSWQQVKDKHGVTDDDIRRGQQARIQRMRA